MNGGWLLCLVMLGGFALTSMLLSSLVAIACRTGLARKLRTANAILAMRLLPGGGAAILVVTLLLPAFLVHEPSRPSEEAGPLLWALAMFALLVLGDAIRRGWSAWSVARALLRRWGVAADRPWAMDLRCGADHDVEIVEMQEPVVAVVGAWRPRIIAAKRVAAACSEAEFRQIIAHELAHLTVKDNLRLLLLSSSPDPLAWTPTAAALATRWRLMAEFEADERAAGLDPLKRVTLASALVKVARLASGGAAPPAVLSMPVASDDIEGRVRRLLAPSPPAGRPASAFRMVVCAVSLPLMAVPFYAPIHRCLEFLVGWGR